MAFLYPASNLKRRVNLSEVMHQATVGKDAVQIGAILQRPPRAVRIPEPGRLPANIKQMTQQRGAFRFRPQVGHPSGKWRVSI
jgi:hypothetical protein